MFNALIFSQNLYNVFLNPEKLTKDHRSKMNTLVDNVNAKLVCLGALFLVEPLLKSFIVSCSTESRLQCQICGYDSYVGEFGGRFCEAGVDESNAESNTR